MGFFKEMEGEACVIIHKGVYRQCAVYTRDGYLYARVGTGFVRLMSDGSTTKAATRLETISILDMYRDPVGRLCLEGTPRSVALPAPQQEQLLGITEDKGEG
jgi:hypothetical protein